MILPKLNQDDTKFQKLVQSELISFIQNKKVEISTLWPDFLVGDDNLFQLLEEQCDLDFYWDEFEDADDAILCIIAQEWFCLPLDVQKSHTEHAMELLKSGCSMLKSSFEYVATYVLGRAFRSYLKSQLEIIINQLEEKALAQNIPHTSVDMFNFIVAEMAE